MRPEQVSTRYFRPIHILYDGGPQGESFAFGWWMPDTPQRELCIARRWNGADNENGYPSSRGYPQWYIEAHLTAPEVLKRIAYGPFPHEPRQLNRAAAARALHDLYMPDGWGFDGVHQPRIEAETTEPRA